MATNITTRLLVLLFRKMKISAYTYKIGSQSFCVGYKANLNHEEHKDHEGDVNRK